ncbi:hypothetical protein MHU86_21964 [Fragilaria crotonensis]|nr:hypothetical protein MHU86_21964 [Fragilaria crotonensis]
MVSVDHSEKDNIDRQAEGERKADHLNAISQLLSEDKTEESGNFAHDDCDDNSENTNDLLLALSRSNDRLDRNYPYEAPISPSNTDIMDYAPTGGIDTYLEATAVDGISPDDSLAAVGGSPKRRKMKEDAGTAFFDTDSAVASNDEDVCSPQSHSSAEMPVSPRKRRVSPEPSSNVERPLSPSKQRPPSPEVNLSPLELLMEEAEILLSKGLHHRPAPRVTSSPISPPKVRGDKAAITADAQVDRPLETSFETLGKNFSPTKNRFGALMMPTVSSMLCSSAAMEYESIDALSPLVRSGNDSEAHRGREDEDCASSNDPTGEIARIPSPEKARFPSPERAVKRVSPVKGRPPSPEKVRVDVSRKNSPEKARFSSPEHTANRLSPEKGRPPSPEKEPRIHSTKKERQSSPEKVRRNQSVEKERRPSPGITPISPARLQRVSPRRRPPTPEREFVPSKASGVMSPGNRRAGEHGKSSVQRKDDIAVSLRSRHNLDVETNELEPAYSFDKDKQGRKTLGEVLASNQYWREYNCEGRRSCRGKSKRRMFPPCRRRLKNMILFWISL